MASLRDITWGEVQELWHHIIVTLMALLNEARGTLRWLAKARF